MYATFALPPMHYMDKKSIGLNCRFQVYNKTFIRWTTHKPQGLSMKDVNMATFSDEQAKVHGEIETTMAESGESFSSKGNGIVDSLKQM